MSWFRVDDHATFHAKVVKAGNEAFGAFCRGGAHSSGTGTDGLVETGVALLIAPVEVWSRLVEAKLAHAEEGGWRLHDYLQWNPSAKQVEKIRKARAAAGKVGGRLSSKRQANMSSGVEANAQAIASTGSKQDGEATRASKGIGSDRMGSGSDLGGPGGPPGPPSADLAEACLAALRRYPCLAELANEDFAHELSVVAFDHRRDAQAIAASIGEAAAREGPRRAVEGAMNLGNLAKFVAGCVAKGPLMRGEPPRAAGRALRAVPVQRGGWTEQDAAKAQARRLAVRGADPFFGDDEPPVDDSGRKTGGP